MARTGGGPSSLATHRRREAIETATPATGRDAVSQDHFIMKVHLDALESLDSPFSIDFWLSVR